jgi:RNA polymerase sigma-70 factor (ECF subfamily)
MWNVNVEWLLTAHLRKSAARGGEGKEPQRSLSHQVLFRSIGEGRIDYSKLREDLVRAVTRLCPAWLSSQRDDLVQAAVMRVMQIVEQQGGGEGVRSFTLPYLYKVAHSALVDEIRRVRRRRESDLDEAEAAPAAITDHDPERIAASREIGRGIQDCLSQMTRERRLAVTLHLQGHSVPDAARVLDWPAKRTENLVYRGLAALRTCLKKKGMGS